MLAGQQNAAWVSILDAFKRVLDTLKASQVPAFLVRKLFQQLFSFLNVQLFNQLLLRRECCSFSNGEFVKMGLGEVEQWIHAADSHWVGESWDQLKNIRQVRSSGLRSLSSLHRTSFHTGLLSRGGVHRRDELPNSFMSSAT